MSNKQKIAVIGGGLSGLVASDALKAYFDVTLFEKARGVGGRMSTRRADPYQFDHGAQYFTARSNAFKAFLDPYINSGLVQEWPAKVLTLEKGKKPYKRDWFEPHYVCTPRMNSLCKNLAEGLDAQFSVEISALSRQEGAWILSDKAGNTHGPYHQIIMAVPAPQAYALLPHDFKGREDINTARMTGCYSVMLGFEKLPALNWDIAMPKESLIGWMAVNSNKPGRKTAPSILIQTTNEWAEIHIDADMDEMEALIVEEFYALSGVSASEVTHKVSHRWRYADTAQPAGFEYFFDDALKIGVCGDWCIKGRIESAFVSANQLTCSIKDKI